METTALRYHQHGSPEQVLQLDTIPVPPPGPGQILARMLFAPINPSDLGSIAGSYGDLPALPAIAGREGLAEIVETGPETTLLPGQRILFPEGTGAWRELATLDEKNIIPVPDDIPPEQAAMATINPPTALLLLEKFVDLRPGDWIIQNAANSAVGHHIIQLCRARGIRTINLVRRESLSEPLKKIGADSVLLDNPDAPQKVRELTAGQLPKLALNSVGGHSAIGLTKCLADGGTHVTYGGMTSDPVRFPIRALIFHDIRLLGFWRSRWAKTTSPTEIQSLMTHVFDLLKTKILSAPIEKTYSLADHKTALPHAATSRTGKILLKP